MNDPRIGLALSLFSLLLSLFALLMAIWCIS